MAGRAGRLGFNEIGKAIILADTPVERAQPFHKYVVEAMQKILRSVDPIEAFEIFEQSIKDYVHYDSISFKFDCFNDEEFVDTALKHKKRLGRLRELGIEGAYLALLWISVQE
jgi:hypothetical protein